MSHYFWTVLLPTVALDLLLGDPHWMPHPVRWMGRTISGLETLLRRLFPKTPGGERWAGVVLALALPTLFGGGSALILWGLGQVSPWLSWVVQLWFSYQLLAARSLQKESMAVYSPLKAHDLEGARRAVSRIVGRDTQALDETGVAKAAVETVAENTSDGVIAPLLFMACGGALAGFFYKAVNTMDSMVGYQNEKYLFFGRAAARLDDVLNYIPARLAAVLMTAACYLTGLDGSNAWRIYKRDRLNHASPNSAQTEAVMAGALGVELAGDAYYFGVLHKKKTIGDPDRTILTADIPRANRLMIATSCLAMAAVAAVRGLLYLF